MPFGTLALWYKNKKYLYYLSSSSNFHNNILPKWFWGQWFKLYQITLGYTNLYLQLIYCFFFRLAILNPTQVLSHTTKEFIFNLKVDFFFYRMEKRVGKWVLPCNMAASQTPRKWWHIRVGQHGGMGMPPSMACSCSCFCFLSKPHHLNTL